MALDPQGDGSQGSTISVGLGRAKNEKLYNFDNSLRKILQKLSFLHVVLSEQRTNGSPS